MNLAHIIKRPIITEKSLLNAGKSIFTFEVDTRASKDQIAEAVASYFKVDVVAVRTTKIPSQTYRAGRRRTLKETVASKKAQVQLKAGQTIDLFDIEQQAS